jgi:hypothetical protein
LFLVTPSVFQYRVFPSVIAESISNFPSTSILFA